MATEIGNAQRGAPEDDKAGKPAALSPAAQRALAEAEARRRARDNEPAPPPEIGRRAGPDPVRYGDWEKNGLASDF